MRLKSTLFAMAFGMIVFLTIAANWARPAPEKNRYQRTLKLNRLFLLADASGVSKPTLKKSTA